jgi:hypothetical protein
VSRQATFELVCFQLPTAIFGEYHRTFSLSNIKAEEAELQQLFAQHKQFQRYMQDSHQKVVDIVCREPNPPSVLLLVNANVGDSKADNLSVQKEIIVKVR